MHSCISESAGITSRGWATVILQVIDILISF